MDGGEMQQIWERTGVVLLLLESPELQLSCSGHENELFMALEGES